MFGGGDIPYENAKYSPWACQNKLGVKLKIGLPAVTDKNEPPFWKVLHDSFESPFLPFRYWLENPLQHATILLQVKRALR